MRSCHATPHTSALAHRARSSWAVVGALALTAFVSACERPAPTTGELDLDALPRLLAQVDMRIGSVEDAEIGFSRISGVDVDRDGRIYVFESLDMQIRVYSPDGDPLHRIGRRGQGPGEFERIVRFGVVGDTVWTFESGVDRITLFDRGGTLLSTAPAQTLHIPVWGGGIGHVQPSSMRADGLFTSHMGRLFGADPGVGAADSVLVPRVLFNGSGAIVDTIGWDGSPPPWLARPASQRRDVLDDLIQVGGRPHWVPQPPGQLPRWSTLHNGQIIVDVPPPTSDDAVFTVTRLGLDRDTVYHRRFHYTPGGYSTAELDALAREAASGFGIGAGPIDPVAETQLREAMAFPEHRPATVVSQADKDERLWIRRYEPPGPTSHWVLLDREGLPLGHLELPGGFRLMWSSGDTFWGVEPDDFDIPWLVRYRME